MRLTPPAVPRQWEAGRHGRPHVLAEQTQGPPSTLAPLCTQGVRPDSPGLHFMVTKTTKTPSRNCQQHGCTRVFGSIFAESDKPYPLWHIDLDPPLTRKSGGPSPACSPARGLQRVWGLQREAGGPRVWRLSPALLPGCLCCHCYLLPVTSGGSQAFPDGL